MAPPYVTPLKRWIEQLASKYLPFQNSLPTQTHLPIRKYRYSRPDVVQPVYMGRSRRIQIHSQILPRHSSWAIHC
jgi:hypothetical protein